MSVFSSRLPSAMSFDRGGRRCETPHDGRLLEDGASNATSRARHAASPKVVGDAQFGRFAFLPLQSGEKDNNVSYVGSRRARSR